MKELVRTGSYLTIILFGLFISSMLAKIWKVVKRGIRNNGIAE